MNENINHVNNVMSFLRGQKEIVTSFVQTNVNQNGEENRGLMMSKENVAIVAKHLFQTNIQEQYFVVDHVVITEDIEPTYCVTVPTNECFSLANGAVVANCRYAIEPMIKNKASLWERMI